MKPASAPSYDLFKLVVTLILVAILLLMLLRGCATNVVPSSPTEIIVVPNTTEPFASLPPPTETVLASNNTETVPTSPAPSNTEAISTPTTVAPTLSPTVVFVTQTNVAAASPDTASAQPSATAVAQATTASTQESASCNTSGPSRLNVGQSARVAQRLNMRNNPSIDATILQTNPTGTQVEVIGGPVCTPVSERAYLWWQIRLADGTEGWSAEAPLNEANYLLEPIP